MQVDHTVVTDMGQATATAGTAAMAMATVVLALGCQFWVDWLVVLCSEVSCSRV